MKIPAYLVSTASGSSFSPATSDIIGPAFQRNAKLAEPFRRAHGENFHAAVAAVAHISLQAEFSGNVLDEAAVAHALHTPGHKKASRMKFLVHGS